MDSGLAAIIGTVVGGGMSFIAQWYNSRSKRGEQQRVAVMQIASQLRLWITETNHDLQEHWIREFANQRADPSDADCPRIAPFPFEKSIDVIPLLPTKLAEAAFVLIELKLSADKETGSMSLVTDNEDIATRYESRIVRIWLMSVKTYALLAHHVGWTGGAATDSEIATMRRRSDEIDEILSRP